MIDVVTVTKRKDWYDIALDSILRQKVDMHWIIIDENIPKNKEVRSMHMNGDTTLMISYLSAPPKKNVSNLNASLNKGLRECTHDYVIFYQDFIVLENDCFRNLTKLASELRAFVGTISKNPPGTREDPRYLKLDCLRPCKPDEWEANVAIAPMIAIQQVGGFDERLDEGWSWDNVALAERAAMLGYDFYIDETIRPQLLDHPKETEIEPNGERYTKIMDAVRAGKEPVKLSYL